LGEQTKNTKASRHFLVYYMYLDDRPTCYFITQVNNRATDFARLQNFRIYPFTITAVLHSSGTFVSGKVTILRKNHDVINAFNCSTTLFYRQGYYYHLQMSRMNTGPQLLWKGLVCITAH